MIEKSLRERASDFPARKQFGQNFLVDKEVLAKIVQELNLAPDDRVLEIGPGLGFLTEILLSKTKNVTAIEIDQYCIDALNKLNLSNLKLIKEDFLQTDLASIIDSPIKIAGNIPYNITTPIISKLLGEIGEPTIWLSNIQSIVLTVQKELANRLIAIPGKKDYSQITLLMNYYGVTKLLFTINPDNFAPMPQVHSAVIQFIPHKNMLLKCNNHKLLRKVIQTGFSSRRKMLKNTLRQLRLDDNKLAEIFKELNFDPEVRPESLALQQFANLTNAIEKAGYNVTYK
jgi:16S rRNA (adenine1518-N6/adenine1519-N6)-dimethyltransferase